MENVNKHADKDPQLLAIARKRASFKYNLVSYLVVNSFLWIIWFLTKDNGNNHSQWPWPLFPMLGWGIGLIFHYMGAYVVHRDTLVDKEYEKLLRNKNK